MRLDRRRRRCARPRARAGLEPLLLIARIPIARRRRRSPPTRGRPRSPAVVRWISAGEPSAIFSPWSSTVTRSEMPMTTFMSCSIRRIVSPRSSRSRCTKRVNSARLLRVHARGRLVEQQELRLACRAPARPRAGAGRRRRGSCAYVVARRSRQAAVMRELAGPVGGAALLPALPRRAQDRLRTIPPFSAGVHRRRARSRAPVIVGNRRMFWNVRPTPSCGDACGGRPATSWPSNTISPRVGV